MTKRELQHFLLADLQFPQIGSLEKCQSAVFGIWLTQVESYLPHMCEPMQAI